MRTCRAQLADWVTCPSAKTPEGKAKIQQITSKLDSIKEQIKKTSGELPSTALPATPDGSIRPASRPQAAVDPVVASGPVGNHIDTYV